MALSVREQALVKSRRIAQLGEREFEGKDMSGGGGGGSSRDKWRPDVPNGGVGADACDITEFTILSSPNPLVVNTLGKDDVLAIELEGQQPQRLVAKTDDGNIAGSITSQRMPDIAECIGAGHEFEAIVRSISGGRVDVLVRRR